MEWHAYNLLASGLYFRVLLLRETIMAKPGHLPCTHRYYKALLALPDLTAIAALSQEELEQHNDGSLHV